MKKLGNYRYEILPSLKHNTYTIWIYKFKYYMCSLEFVGFKNQDEVEDFLKWILI